MTAFAIGFAFYVTLSSLIQREYAVAPIESREITKYWNGCTSGE